MLDDDFKTEVIKHMATQTANQGNIADWMEKLDGKEGDTIRFDQVLLLVDAGKVTIGRPLVKGAVVKAKILEQFKGKKIRVATYKAKSRYRRVLGHRKHLTKLQIQTISASKTAKKAVSKKTKS